MQHEKIIVMDFGGQYNQLIARRVRECNVYCEIYSYKRDIEEIKAMNPKGIILTGGGSLLQGMETLIEEKTGIHTLTAENPMMVVAEGTGMYAQVISEMK